MKKKTRQILAIVCNALIVLLELAGITLSIIEYGDGSFEYYTQESNYLALLASALYLPLALRQLRGGKALPKWAASLRHMASGCVALTFFVVVFVLAPMDEQGFASLPHLLFSGSMLYLHFLCPVLAMLSFLLFETEPCLGKRCVLTGLLPTFVYAAIVLCMNLTRTLVGPYPFLHVYEQPWYMSCVWIVVILGMAALFSWLLWLGNRAIGNKARTAQAH